MTQESIRDNWMVYRLEIEIWVRDNLKSIQIIQVKLALSKGIKYNAVSKGKRL